MEGLLSTGLTRLVLDECCNKKDLNDMKRLFQSSYIVIEGLHNYTSRNFRSGLRKVSSIVGKRLVISEAIKSMNEVA